MLETDSRAANKQTTSRSTSQASPLLGSYQTQNLLPERNHSSKELSNGLEHSLPSPSVAASRIMSIGLASKTASPVLSRCENTGCFDSVSTSIPDKPCLAFQALSVGLEDRSPFHEGYVAMSGYEESCVFCGHNFRSRM
jgi:hypothetical protein